MLTSDVSTNEFGEQVITKFNSMVKLKMIIKIINLKLNF
jgi:hypothetical protein